MATISGRLVFDSARTINDPPTLPGIANVPVVLQDVASGVMLAVLTDTNGNFSFINVPDGNYQIVEYYGMIPAIPTPGDFSTASTGAILEGGVVPPLGYAPAPVPAGATDLDCVTPNTLLIAVTGSDVTEKNILNGPVKYMHITSKIDSHAVVSPDNLIVDADNGTFGTWPPGTSAGTHPPANPYPGVGEGFAYVQSNSPQDGEFTIMNTANRGMSMWWRISDHTAGNETGRFMLINGHNPGAVIFKETVTVKPDTHYLFSTWILNMINVAGYRDPAIGVRILDSNGEILVEQTLGQFLPKNLNTPEWVHIGSAIYSGNNTALTVVFVSQGPATHGNDYAVDDIGLYEITMPELILMKTGSVSNADVGDDVTYTVTLANIYDRAITNVVFMDAVPDGLSFVPGSVTVNGVSQPSADPNTGFKLPDVPGREEITVTFSAAVVKAPPVNPALNTARMTYEYTIVEGGIPSAHDRMSNEVPLYIRKPKKPCLCCTPATKCRRNIRGQKTWVDDDNKGKTRPAFVKITLLRDGKLYKSVDVDSTGDGAFTFCCVPIGKKPGHKYDYQIDEVVPDGYTKTVKGYYVINTLNP